MGKSRRHHPHDPHEKAKKGRRGAAVRRGGVGAYGYAGMPSYGMGYYQGSLGQVVSTYTNPPTSGPPPASDVGCLNGDQFAGYPGGYSVGDTGVGNDGGDVGTGGGGDAGASGGSPS